MSLRRIRLSRSGSRRRTSPMAARARPVQPGRHLLLEAADPVEHVVDPPAGGLLHHRLQRLALPEGVEHRRDRADLHRVRAEEHQVVEHPVQLGQRHPQPDRALGDLHAHQPLDGEHHAELVGEGREPVVPVGQHDDLPVVADLEELLGAAVHVADDRLAGDHPLAVEDQLQPQHAVGGGVLRADVQHHVGAELRVVAAVGDQAGSGADGQLTQVTGSSAHARHRATSGGRSTPTGCSSHQWPPSPAGSVSSAAAEAAASART